MAAKRDKKQAVFVVGGSQKGGDSAVERATQSHHHRAPLGQQNSQYGAFDWGVESADDNLIGFGNVVCPAAGKIERLGGRCARSEEGHQSSVEQLLISG